LREERSCAPRSCRDAKWNERSPIESYDSKGKQAIMIADDLSDAELENRQTAH